MSRYTLTQVAEMVSIHKQTIYRWEKAGRIPQVKRLARTKERIYTDEDVDKIKEYRDRTCTVEELNEQNGNGQPQQ
jgi:excisionase family DNA binding protein